MEAKHLREGKQAPCSKCSLQSNIETNRKSPVPNRIHKLFKDKFPILLQLPFSEEFLGEVYTATHYWVQLSFPLHAGSALLATMLWG